MTKIPKRAREAPTIVCACGCGEELKSRNRHGNKRRFIHGHATGRKYGKEAPPVSLRADASVLAVTRRERKWVRKMACLRHYGGAPPKCGCCGESDPIFLAIDHLGGSGNQHRKEIGSKGGASFYNWLIRNGFPQGFGVLCHNCNMATAILGYCPHKGPESAEQKGRP